MQTPPTNDAAARAAAVKARWKRAVRAVQEPLTPSVAEELPPPPSQPLWSGPPSHPLWLIPDDLDPAAGLIDRMTLERLMLAHRPTTATRPRPFEYLLAEARDALSEVTLRSGASVGAPLRREHRAARPPPRTCLLYTSPSPRDRG